MWWYASLACLCPLCLSLFLCIFARLLAYVIKPSSYYLVQVHTCLWYTRPWVPSGTLLDGTRVSSILQHNGTMDTRSKPTFVLLGHHHGLDLVWLHPTPVWLCLGVTTCEMHLSDVGLLYTYPFLTPCNDMLPLLACAPIGSLCFYASLHAYLHVHAWVLLACVIKPSSYYLVRVRTRLWYMRT